MSNQTDNRKPESSAGFAALGGSDALRGIASEWDVMVATLDNHHRLAAEVRCLLHNGGAGPNLTQFKRCDVMLREIAGLPAEHQNDKLSDDAHENSRSTR